MVKFIKSETLDKLKASFQKFCNATHLHGANEAYYAKSMIWTVLWTIVTVGACLVTGYQCYNAGVQYVEQGSMTQVLPPEKGGVLYPSLAMCYIHWIYWVNFEKAFKMGFTKETIQYAMSFVQRIFSPNWFNVTEAKENFVKTLAVNNLTTLTQFYESIAMTFPMTEGGVFSFVMKNPPFFKTAKLMYKPPKYYMCYTVSSEEISKVLEENRNRSGRISKQSNGLFSYSVQDPNYNLIKHYISYEEYNYYAAYWLCERSSYWSIHLEDYAKNYVKFTMPIRMFPDANSGENVVLKTDNEEYNVLMKPSVKRSRNSQKEPCIEGAKSLSTNNKCQRSCEAIKHNQLAECAYIDEAAIFHEDTVDKLCSNPINFLPFQRENPDFKRFPCDNFVPEGSDDKFRTNQTVVPKPLNLNNDTVDEINEKYKKCVESCTDPCEMWQYSASVSILTGTPSVLENTFKNQTNFNFYYPQETDVLIIIDVDSQTWEDFVANVGGLIGVWTGASFITFLQLPYLCCCVDYDDYSLRSYFVRKRKLKPVENHVNTNFAFENETNLNLDNRENLEFDHVQLEAVVEPPRKLTMSNTSDGHTIVINLD